MTTMQHAGLARGLPPHANVSEVDGEYVIEIDLVARSARSTVRRRVALQGDGITSIDLAQAAAR